MSRFIRYELTAHIFETLKPGTANFTCKDGIDRGPSHSLIFNLLAAMKAVEQDKQKQVMSKNEFMQGLHAAAMHVKGRGMNHHIETVWNTLETHVRAKLLSYRESGMAPEKIKRIIPEYLIEWLKENIPESRKMKDVTPIYGEPYDLSRAYDRTRSLDSLLKINHFNLPQRPRPRAASAPARLSL